VVLDIGFGEWLLTGCPAKSDKERTIQTLEQFAVTSVDLAAYKTDVILPPSCHEACLVYLDDKISVCQKYKQNLDNH
jgi:hypothetical protein